MLSSNKTFYAFDGSQKPLAFVGVYCVLCVLLMRDYFQVLKAIVRAVKIFVVDFKSSADRLNKSFPYQPMHTTANRFSVAAKVYMKIAFYWPRVQQSMPCVANPYDASFDVAGSSHAGTQKISNFAKQGAFCKHALGFGHFSSVQSLASRSSADVSKIADFIQIFKLRHWFPRFHALPLINENRSIA